jgi:predicted nucleotidyltransferase component of viral defense system
MDQHELQRWSQKLNIAPTEILREAMELVVLQQLAQSELNDFLVFKGGTALRLCYQSPRFSQDLDFNELGLTAHSDYQISRDQLRTLLVTLAKQYAELEVSEVIRKHHTLFALLTIDSSCLAQRFSIKLEISTRVYDLKAEHYSLQVAQSAISPLKPMLRVYSLERIFDEKKMAVATREKPRDYFDLWFVAQQLNQSLNDLPPIKMPASKFKGELNQLLPRHLRDWADDFYQQFKA